MDEVDRIWRETEMSSFLLDYTFQTNKEGLLLGAVGTVGLTVSSRGPSMRFLPVLFMLASSEDSDAQKRLLFLFLEKSHDLGIPLSDAFLDCRYVLYLYKYIYLFFIYTYIYIHIYIYIYIRP